ncbi:MAG: hypothetical protein KAJ97_11415, partial [Acidobacteria bacterium]|nr:hypothetical protein [Acidobacteriota bacterium]
MNMKRVAVIAGVVIAVVLAIVLFRGEKISGPSSDRVSTGYDLIGANVLLITLDTTRADRIGAYNYPGAETP